MTGNCESPHRRYPRDHRRLPVLGRRECAQLPLRPAREMSLHRCLLAPALRELDFVRGSGDLSAAWKALRDGRPMRRGSSSGDGKRTHAERLASVDGYFAPKSVIRRVGNTPVTPFLGGGTAVLLQVAHPLVAAGVAEHSVFEADLWRRLVGTLRALYLVTFGSKREADQAGAVVQAVHARVNGAIRNPLGPFPAATRYSATDPELMLWVHATLIHASLSAYQRFERRLSAADQESYYRDMATVAHIFGTPAGVIPATLNEFHEYFAAQIASAEITVTAPAQEIARVILHAPLPTPMGLLGPAHRLATTALLPTRLRHEYGLRWSPIHAPLLMASAQSVRWGSWPILRVAGRLRPPIAAPSAGY
jgi:uncharacterized protein (DUF2236 family)